MIGDDNIGAGPLDAGEDFQRGPLLFHPAVGRRCLDHRIFTADIIGGYRQFKAVPHFTDHIHISHCWLDHDDVGPFGNVEIDFPITSYAFQYSLLGRAKANKKTIVLPEGEEDRIIKAADYLLEREIANLIIVGDKGAILARGAELGLTHLGKARFQAMDDENILKPMVAKLCELRAKKGMTEEQARKQLTDASYFGTMLVVLGYADGLVSGAVNSTANTVRPALE